MQTKLMIKELFVIKGHWSVLWIDQVLSQSKAHFYNSKELLLRFAGSQLSSIFQPCLGSIKIAYRDIQ